jgi:SAM-dependent methyltransferase
VPAGTELLDDLAADPGAVHRCLTNIARSNRWFGGWAAARYGLARVLRRTGRRSLTLLDVGTGSGDVPAELVRWAAARGVALAPLGLERHPAAARIASQTGLLTLRADGGCLPLARSSVDVVMLCQVAHHLEAEELERVCRECTRVARVAVVLTDLRPSRWAMTAFRVASRVLGFDRWTEVDGVTSLRRGFTTGALRNTLHRIGIEAEIVARPWARIVAIWGGAV